MSIYHFIRFCKKNHIELCYLIISEALLNAFRGQLTDYWKGGEGGRKEGGREREEGREGEREEGREG